MSFWVWAKLDCFNMTKAPSLAASSDLVYMIEFQAARTFFSQAEMWTTSSWHSECCIMYSCHSTG